MTYLLDTHVIIWLLFEPKKLSKTTNQILSNTGNKVIASAINFWEISIKYNSGKLGLGNRKPDDLPQLLIDSGFIIQNLSATAASSLYHLIANYHKDPFDRMLIWLAIHNDYTLISNDQYIKLYTSQGLQVTW